MSKMLRIELVGLLLLACTQILTEHRDFRESRDQYGYHQRFHDLQERITREVRVKEGRLRGMVVQPRTNHNLQLVDVFLGVPYAEPPVGSFRFSPPRSPQPWRGVRQSQEFAPVCPQVLPNLREEVKPGRYEYLERHLPYLRNQSEDCLYLNIYAPHQAEGQKSLRKYPVMVFIHGESFEWNSGNPYDGTILAAYGNIVFVTINFRLGILGFLRPGIRDDTASNFGLLDQIAALLWLRENVAEFGGDPNSVTLVGHGTGAVFANLLLISPVANKKGLFKRAILMSGSAMSADAIGKAPLQITKQVAHALNCPTTSDNELALCLRNQDVDRLLHVKIHKPKYVPAYAPLIDRAVIPDKPLNLMENIQLFGRFDLMYGITESEKFHILPPVALLHGMLDGQRDEILRDHAKATHELEPELILSKVLEQYGDFSSGFTKEYATKNRDMVLEALSDSGTVAPLIMTANLHSRANPKSYMYVFSHPKAMQDYSGQQRQHTVHGEELPYVLGVPLDGSKFRGRYNIRETLFSEAIMNWWCSFAYIGNPNVAKRFPYLTSVYKEWEQYEIEWPEYDPVNQTYLNLTIPPNMGAHYRSVEMQFWNEDLPNLLRHPNKDISSPTRPRGPRPQILDFADGIGKYANNTANRKYEARYTSPSSITDSSTEQTPLSTVLTTGGNIGEGSTIEPNTLKASSAMMMVIVFFVVFILINFTAFLYIYYKRQNVKGKEKSLKRRGSEKKNDSVKRSKTDKHENHYGQLGYKSDSKPDLNDVIKNDKAYDNNSNFGRRSKLSRQNSSSTIDTHIKVREWIQQEIVHRCSPRFLRKTRETLQKEHQEKLTKQQQEEKQRIEEEALKERKDEPIYDESPALVVRPGKKSKLPKISVAIDATPATRTESILNQVPIELTKSIEIENDYEPSSQQLMAPEVVVIEHHHSRSDPLPMENVLKTIKPNFSTPRIYPQESDSGSASSLYAKINPKLKSRLPRPDLGTNTEAPLPEQSMYENPQEEEIYIKTGQILTTFGTNDVNVTCREPTAERESISPEEALKTIKRRNYPKVLPDIEKRRSLPVPSSLFVPKQYANSLQNCKNGNRANLFSNQPPLPPPRIFGTSKSLQERGGFLAEENESQIEGEPITTNLHVGPLLKRPDSAKNNSDPNIIDSLEGNRGVQAGGSVDAIYANPKCPLHGSQYLFSPTSQSVDDDIGKSSGILDLGNPNWYKPAASESSVIMTSTASEPQIVIGRDERGTVGATVPMVEPKIVITPRVVNPCQVSQQTSPTARSEDKIEHGSRAIDPTRNGGTRESPNIFGGSIILRETEKREPRIIITAREPKNCAPVNSLKQPKIIIKPTATLPRSRDQRNIPKVSAIPSPEQQNCQNSERDRALEQREKPSLREKPRVTRIPSFSRRREEPGIEKPSYVEKTEIAPRVEAATSKITNAPSTPDTKSGIPTPTTTMMPKSEKTSSTDSSASNGNSSNSNTGTIKRKPANKK